ncbi:uncharacterized protein VTP21DRAFT_6062 [Calcarisporiella thermophila]|uniref:uncharacterized protein n=1 Tax=Calcarisporiella thermophila TaxID=911321 RepID=UPI0037438C3E
MVDIIPPPLEFENHVFDIALHPSQDIIATGLITGHVHCHRYSSDGNIELFSLRPHKKSCRGVTFSPDGAGLISISKDKSIQAIDLNSCQIVSTKPESHENPINTLLALDENILATGDDAGIIKLWDIRQGTEVMKYSEHEDFIADMTFCEERRSLIVAGGDGYLSVWDIRKPDLVAMSDNQEDELLSVEILKDGKKVVVGSQEGILNLWTWGDWGDVSDRFLGHPNSIDAICRVDEDTIVTGSSDGIIRVIGILPNKFHGIIGEHEDFPVEQIKMSWDKRYLASCSHDAVVRFWDVRYLFESEEEEETKDEQKDEDENDTGGMEVDEEGSGSKKRRKNKKEKNAGPVDEFFADL